MHQRAADQHAARLARGHFIHRFAGNIHAIAANGNTVLTERTDTFFMADKSTISVRVMGAFEIENGKISKWRDYFDPAEAANIQPPSVYRSTRQPAQSPI